MPVGVVEPSPGPEFGVVYKRRHGYNFELTDDFKKAIKQAADDVEACKQQNLRQKGAHAAATTAATAAGGSAQSATRGSSAPTSGGGSSASHAALGKTKQSHPQALPSQPASGATSSIEPTIRAPKSGGKKRARDGRSSSSSGSTQQRAMAPLTTAELEAATTAMLNQMFAGECDQVPFDALFARLAAEDALVNAAGRAAVVEVLAEMQAADKIMHSEGNIHLI